MPRPLPRPPSRVPRPHLLESFSSSWEVRVCMPAAACVRACVCVRACACACACECVCVCECEREYQLGSPNSHIAGIFLRIRYGLQKLIPTNNIHAFMYMQTRPSTKLYPVKIRFDWIHKNYTCEIPLYGNIRLRQCCCVAWAESLAESAAD